jgi:enoyl-CoA hydratase/carnithine racemase
MNSKGARMDSPVLIEKKGNTAIVTLNRLGQKNAIDLAMRKGLCQAWEEIERDREIFSVILSGGEMVFSAGQDLVELSEFRKKEPVAELPLNNLETFGLGVKKPVIAAISGPCLGAGFLLTMVCSDVRVASESAQFGMPEVKVGVPPSFGIPAILCRHFSPAMAAALLLFGRRISAQDALRAGFVNEVVPVSEMHSTAEKYAREVNEMSPLITRNIKEVLRKVTDPDPLSVAYCNAMCTLGRRSEDYVEGPRAFRERRKPVWKGR